MKLFFCLHDTTRGLTSRYAQLLMVAIWSAIKTNRFQIHLIFDGDNDALIEWCERQGVNIISHQTVLAEDILKTDQPKGRKNIALGAFNRLDVPEIVRTSMGSTDEYVLYCDVDVMFMRDVGDELQRLQPYYFAMNVEKGPIWSRAEVGNNHFNSGVCLMNVDNLLKVRQKFLAYCRADLNQIMNRAFDQFAINQFFAGKIDLLAPEYNWRPYWKKNPKAGIIHYHGTKPTMNMEMARNHPRLKGLIGNEFEPLCQVWKNTLHDLQREW